jgi:hypothetical protein
VKEYFSLVFFTRNHEWLGNVLEGLATRTHSFIVSPLFHILFDLLFNEWPCGEIIVCVGTDNKKQMLFVENLRDVQELQACYADLPFL